MNKKESKEKTFTISKDQVKKLEEWQGHIKAIYGEYGDYDYVFNSGGGIGVGITVFSSLTKQHLLKSDKN